MKPSHENFGETLARLLGQCPHPSSTRMESGIKRVWERLHSEIGDAPSELASDSLTVRRSWTPSVALVNGMVALRGSVVTLLTTFVRSLRRSGSSADE